MTTLAETCSKPTPFTGLSEAQAMAEYRADGDRDDVVSHDPLAALESTFIEAYLRARGYTGQSLQAMPEEAARQRWPRRQPMRRLAWLNWRHAPDSCKNWKERQITCDSGRSKCLQSSRLAPQDPVHVLDPAIYRFASHAPVPGVSQDALRQLLQSGTPTASLANLLDLLSGRTIANFSVLAMGVYPYITASIILQMLS